MVSTELLRRYPFFGVLTEAQLQDIAMITDVFSAAEETKLFDEAQSAQYLYMLIDGSVDLAYKSEEEFHPKAKKEFHVGEINPGEVFGISGLVAPFEYSATGTVQAGSEILQIDAVQLRNLMDSDNQLGYIIMQQVTKALMERLAYTRVQLAAAWA